MQRNRDAKTLSTDEFLTHWDVLKEKYYNDDSYK